MAITRLNHAVLYVRNAGRSAAFFRDVLGFETVADELGGRAVFLRAGGSTNHHDLAVFSVGDEAAASSAGRGAVGLYHLAWEVETIDELVAMRERLVAAGALVGQSDHGVSKSLYATDPDGIEFEVMWRVPEADWGHAAHRGVVRPLDLDAEVARYATR